MISPTVITETGSADSKTTIEIVTEETTIREIETTMIIDQQTVSLTKDIAMTTKEPSDLQITSEKITEISTQQGTQSPIEVTTKETEIYEQIQTEATMATETHIHIYQLN